MDAPRSSSEQPLLVRPVPPTTARLDTKKFLGACVAVGSVLVLVFGLHLHRNFAATTAVREAPLPDVHEVRGSSGLETLITVPRSYAGMDRRPPPVPEATKDAPPPMVAAASAPVPAPQLMQVPAPPVTPVPAAPGPAPVAVPVIKNPPPAKTPPPAPVSPPPPARWLFAEVQGRGGVAAPPFPAAAPRGEAPASTATTAGPGTTLLRAAQAVKPPDPTRVLYRSHVITGMLLHEVNSDVPGQVRIMVTQPVTDKLHRGQVLIPQGSIVLAVQEKTPDFGHNRLALKIEEVHAPDGTILALPGQVADRSGAMGATGTVNHHLGTMGVAAILSVALNVGARSLAGTPSGYHPTLGQELAREAGESVNRTAQSIVQRSLNIPPTITLKAGTPVTLQLAENLILPPVP